MAAKRGKRGPRTSPNDVLMRAIANSQRGKLTDAERIQDITGDVRVTVAQVADRLSDLNLARAELASGDVAGALSTILNYLSNKARHVQIRGRGGYVGDDEVTDRGDINDAAVQVRVEQVLWLEGYGPRPVRATGR